MNPSADSLLCRYKKDLRMNLIYLPDSFMSFYKENFNRKCSNCHRLNIVMVCLICDWSVCSLHCPFFGGATHKNTMVSNIAKHSFECHNGTSAFVCNDNGMACLVEQTRLQLFVSVYKEKFSGTPFNQEHPKHLWDCYFLNKQLIGQLHKSIMQLRVSDQITLENLGPGKFDHISVGVAAPQ